MKLATGHPTEDFRMSKHIELQYHPVREKMMSGEIHVGKIGTCEMAADVLTETMSGEEDLKENMVQLKEWKTIGNTK